MSPEEERLLCIIRNVVWNTATTIEESAKLKREQTGANILLVIGYVLSHAQDTRNQYQDIFDWQQSIETELLAEVKKNL